MYGNNAILTKQLLKGNGKPATSGTILLSDTVTILGHAASTA